jgi:hypothetical protein
MPEMGQSGSEGGVALTPPSLPLSGERTGSAEAGPGRRREPGCLRMEPGARQPLSVTAAARRGKSGAGWGVRRGDDPLVVEGGEGGGDRAQVGGVSRV